MRQTQTDIDALRSALASQPDALAALERIAAPRIDLDEALTYGRGCAAALEAILKGHAVPPENMQHVIDGFWRAVGQEPAPNRGRLSTYFVRTALELEDLLGGNTNLAVAVMDEQAAKIAADEADGGPVGQPV